MFSWLYKFGKGNKKNVDKVAERELRENRGVLESLRDYDAGRKNLY